MDGLVLNRNSELLLEDVKSLFVSISECVGRKLDPSIDSIHMSKPDDWLTRSSARHILRCKISEDRYVMLKRCSDNPDFIRREEIVAQAKSKLNWDPNYSVVKIQEMKLRNSSNGKSFEPLKDWNNKTILVVDIGNYKLAQNLTKLNLGDIKDLGWFCFSYGRWGHSIACLVCVIETQVISCFLQILKCFIQLTMKKALLMQRETMPVFWI